MRIKLHFAPMTLQLTVVVGSCNAQKYIAPRHLTSLQWAPSLTHKSPCFGVREISLISTNLHTQLRPNFICIYLYLFLSLYNFIDLIYAVKRNPKHIPNLLVVSIAYSVTVTYRYCFDDAFCIFHHE